MHDYEVISRLLDYWSPQMGGVSDWFSGTNIYDEFHFYIPECQKLLIRGEYKDLKDYLDYIQYEAMGNRFSEARDLKTAECAQNFLKVWTNHSRSDSNIRAYSNKFQTKNFDGREYLIQTKLDVLKLLTEEMNIAHYRSKWLEGEDSLSHYDEICFKMLSYFEENLPIKDYVEKMKELFDSINNDNDEPFSSYFKTAFGYLCSHRAAPSIVTRKDPMLCKHKLVTLYINKEAELFK